MSRAHAQLDMLRRGQSAMLAPTPTPYTAPPKPALACVRRDINDIPDDLQLPEPTMPLPPAYGTIEPSPPPYAMRGQRGFAPRLWHISSTAAVMMTEGDLERQRGRPAPQPSPAGPNHRGFLIAMAMMFAFACAIYGFGRLASSREKH